jgi:FkbM family methyltransferase
MLARTVDGRRLLTPLSSDSGLLLYFLGEYEPAITDVVRRVVRSGDTCLDIGANLGWYTTLLSRLVQPHGSVHAFEPLPSAFRLLEENVELNPCSSTVLLNAVALGERAAEVDLHVFSDLPDGHASLSDLGRDDASVSSVKLVTLDSYLEERGIGDVAFVKADLEGSERSMLEGATRLFAQARPPIFEIEMALATSRGFGYQPNDLIDFFNARGAFDFYAIDERRSTLMEFEAFPAGHIGANVLCIPKNDYPERRARLGPIEAGGPEWRQRA